MTSEASLEKLLASLNPTLRNEEYVFCTLAAQTIQNLNIHPVCIFEEDESTTVVCTRGDAEESGLEFIFPCRMITLKVHSSLEAVGLTAAVATKLAEAGISANVVAAFYHDHIFVPSDKAEEALRILLEFSK
jgi:hypothetical protein